MLLTPSCSPTPSSARGCFENINSFSVFSALAAQEWSGGSSVECSSYLSRQRRTIRFRLLARPSCLWRFFFLGCSMFLYSQMIGSLRPLTQPSVSSGLYKLFDHTACLLEEYSLLLLSALALQVVLLLCAMGAALLLFFVSF